MKTLSKTLLFFLPLIMLSCGGNDADTASSTSSSSESTEAPAKESNVPASQRVDLENKGVGPITSLELDPDIDRPLAVEGKKVFDQMRSEERRVGKVCR